MNLSEIRIWLSDFITLSAHPQASKPCEYKNPDDYAGRNNKAYTLMYYIVNAINL